MCIMMPPHSETVTVPASQLTNFKCIDEISDVCRRDTRLFGISKMAGITKQVAATLFLVCTAALAMLVHVVTVNHPDELMIRQGIINGRPMIMGRGYGLALQPVGDGEAPGDSDVTLDAPEADESEPADVPAVDPEVQYASLHPVYTRCAARVDMMGFSLAIQKSCGDIHELNDVAWPCRSTMTDYSKKFGCCWETVMNAYEALYPEAASSWRLWQGTLSGKAGVTFDAESCGESEGEKGYSDLHKEVKSLKDIIETQSDEIMTLENYLGYGGDPYYYYYYKGDKAGLKQNPKLSMFAPSKAYHPENVTPNTLMRRKAVDPKSAFKQFSFLDNAKGAAALRRAGVKV